MILGILGDLHFCSRGPTRRKDDFFLTQMSKFKQAFSIFKKYNCQYVIQPGDFFDNHVVSNRVKAEIIKFLRKELWYEEGIFFVAGQHDISGHSLYTLKNSPLAVLQASGVGTLLSDSPRTLINGNEKVEIYGASYGEPIPEPVNPENYNILVLHRMIGDRELFPGQELEKPNQFLRNNSKYSFVCCGDYHYSFSSDYQGRTIVNAGCIVRKTISKWDLEHEPSVVIFDTETNEAKFVKLAVDPVEEVFDLGRETKIGSVDSSKFLSALKEQLNLDSKKTVSWKNILSMVVDEKKCSEPVRKKIDEYLEKVQK